MDLLTFNAARCDLCEECTRNCPFQALTMEASASGSVKPAGCAASASNAVRSRRSVLNRKPVP